MLGAVTAQERDNAKIFPYFRAGFDLHAERQAREEAGVGEHTDGGDLYPDARPALAELRTRGLRVGVAGDQTVRAGELLRDLDRRRQRPGLLEQVLNRRPPPTHFDGERHSTAGPSSWVLALAEAASRLSDRPDPVRDEIWDEAARHYDEQGLAALLLMVATTKVFNTLNVSTRQPAGVGEWG